MQTPHWEQAAKTIAEDSDESVSAVKLATVDATIEKGLAEKFKMTGFPTIKIFSGPDSEPEAYDGPREAPGIISWIKKRVGPASQMVSDGEEATKVKDANKVMAVYASKDGSGFEEWEAIAETMRKNPSITFVHTSEKKVMSTLGVKEGITLVKDSTDEPTAVFSGRVNEEAAVTEWIKKYSSPAVVFLKKGDQDAIKLLFQDTERVNVFLFTLVEEGVSAFKEATADQRGKMGAFYLQKEDFPEAFAHFGMDKLEKEEFPAVQIQDQKAD